jgi:DNA-binding CsgD family transcriptional regulator
MGYRLRHRDREIDLSAGEFTIGRASACDLCLTGGLVSRRHARLRTTSDGILLEDLGSRNGVLVNNRKVQGPTLLGHGDVIGIGLESLELVDEQVLNHPEELSTLPPPPSRAPPGEADVDAPEQTTALAQLDVLTDREREVLELIVFGHTQREIADRLHISVKTIETHRARLADKLGCRTRAELVAYAVTAGLLRVK